MRLEDFLIEEQIKNNRIPLEEGFSFFKKKKSEEIVALEEELLGFSKDILSEKYFEKVKEILPNIRISSKNMKDSVVAYTLGKRIYLNDKKFFRTSKKTQMEYLLHELIHIIQEKDKDLVKNGEFIFNLLKARRKDKKQSLSEILTGIKNLSGRYFNDREIIPYLLNNKIDFDYLKEGTKEELKEYLAKEKIFNLNSNYWKVKFK